MSSTFLSEWKNEETNSKPLSEVMCERTPCLEKTWRMNNLVSIRVVMVSTVGIKIDCLESLSTITRIVSYPEDRGSFSIKSMEIEF